MKSTLLKQLLLLSSLLLVSISNAQEAVEPYFCMKEGAEFEYTKTNSKGEIEGYDKVMVLDVQKNITNGDTLGVITYSVNPMNKDREAQMDEPMEIMTYFDDEALTIDLVDIIKSIIKSTIDYEGEDDEEFEDALEISGESAILPNYMKTGDKLPDSSCSIKVMFITMIISVTDREVLREESITTDTGTYLCVVVQESISEKIVWRNKKTKTVTWYSRGIGMIKQETYNKKGKLETTEILTSKKYS